MSDRRRPAENFLTQEQNLEIDHLRIQARILSQRGQTLLAQAEATIESARRNHRAQSEYIENMGRRNLELQDLKQKNERLSRQIEGAEAKLESLERRITRARRQSQDTRELEETFGRFEVALQEYLEDQRRVSPVINNLERASENIEIAKTQAAEAISDLSAQIESERTRLVRPGPHSWREPNFSDGLSSDDDDLLSIASTDGIPPMSDYPLSSRPQGPRAGSEPSASGPPRDVPTFSRRPLGRPQTSRPQGPRAGSEPSASGPPTDVPTFSRRPLGRPPTSRPQGSRERSEQSASAPPRDVPSFLRRQTTSDRTPSAGRTGRGGSRQPLASALRPAGGTRPSRANRSVSFQDPDESRQPSVSRVSDLDLVTRPALPLTSAVGQPGPQDPQQQSSESRRLGGSIRRPRVAPLPDNSQSQLPPSGDAAPAWTDRPSPRTGPASRPPFRPRRPSGLDDDLSGTMPSTDRLGSGQLPLGDAAPAWPARSSPTTELELPPRRQPPSIPRRPSAEQVMSPAQFRQREGEQRGGGNPS